MEFRERVLIQFLYDAPMVLEQMMEEVAQHWQISASEVKLLLFLLCVPQLDTAKDLAAHCGMSKASVSGNVLKLTTRGLITVDMDLKDRRFQHLSPTDAAEPILENIRQKVQNFKETFLRPLAEEECSRFLEMLARINAANGNWE